MRKVDMEYHKIEGIENALREVRIGTSPVGHVYTFEPFFGQLARALANRNPHWTLISEWSAYGATNPITRAAIYEDDEKLGWVHKRSWGEDKYEFDNHRLKNSRSRGSATFTKDKAKAIKLIEKNFYGKTDAERLTDAKSKTITTVRASTNRLIQDFTGKMHLVTNELRKYAIDNWSVVGPKITTPELVDKIPLAKEEHDVGKRIASALHSDEGAVVHIRGERYLVQPLKSSEIKQYDTYSLTGGLKVAVGMLKLLPKDGDYIADVGVKITRNTFYVMRSDEVTSDEEKKEQE